MSLAKISKFEIRTVLLRLRVKEKEVHLTEKGCTRRAPKELRYPDLLARARSLLIYLLAYLLVRVGARLTDFTRVFQRTPLARCSPSSREARTGCGREWNCSCPPCARFRRDWKIPFSPRREN